MTASVTTDKAAVLELIRRLRGELAGAGDLQIEGAVQDSNLRVALGDLLTGERITAEEAREALGELSTVVFVGPKRGG
ncbi:MAG TPA: hypothetical protein VGB98_24735 [Pyrinomonadaceae bacterium]|jgi:hypothetical protein